MELSLLFLPSGRTPGWRMQQGENFRRPILPLPLAGKTMAQFGIGVNHFPKSFLGGDVEQRHGRGPPHALAVLALEGGELIVGCQSPGPFLTSSALVAVIFQLVSPSSMQAAFVRKRRTEFVHSRGDILHVRENVLISSGRSSQRCQWSSGRSGVLIGSLSHRSCFQARRSALTFEPGPSNQNKGRLFTSRQGQ